LTWAGAELCLTPGWYETHQSTTDPEARLARKGPSAAAKLSYAGHLLMENRSALIADMDLSLATGYAERETALRLLQRLPKSARRRRVAGDKGYDTRDFVAGCREIGVTPHVAPNTTHRRSAIDGRTTRHAGHVTSLRIRKQIEEPFGWMKTVAGGRKLRYIGLQRNRAWFLMTGAVYNLIRITALDAQAARSGGRWTSPDAPSGIGVARQPPLAHRVAPQPFLAPPGAKITAC
jgi:hypothetical protein